MGCPYLKTLRLYDTPGKCDDTEEIEYADTTVVMMGISGDTVVRVECLPAITRCSHALELFFYPLTASLHNNHFTSADFQYFHSTIL